MFKKFSLFFPILIAALALSAQAFAQTATPQPAASNLKLGFVDTRFFYEEKTGITRLVNAYKALNAELKPKTDELQSIATRIQTLEKELTALQAQANGGAQIDRNAAAAKSEEYERLKREGKFKQDEYSALYDRRRAAVVGPVSQDIGKALNDFAKQKGFGIVVDISKFDEANALLFLSDSADSTKEFIAYMNARPATPAAATPARPAAGTRPN